MTTWMRTLIVATGITLLSLTATPLVRPVMSAQAPLPVDVVNPSTDPVPVVLQGCELHQEAQNAEFDEPFMNFPINVSTGKRLIIESASARVTLPAGQRAHASISGNFSTGVGVQYLSLAFQGTFNGSDVYTTTQPVRLYVNAADGGFNIVRNGVGTV